MLHLFATTSFTTREHTASHPRKQHLRQSNTGTMSFDQLSSLESQQRRNNSNYTDDPEFDRLSQDLMNKLFTLTGNISRLRTEIGHLGTRRDTARVRERVHDLIEESSEILKGVGEGVKKIQTWEDVTVCQPCIVSLPPTTSVR